MRAESPLLALTQHRKELLVGKWVCMEGPEPQGAVSVSSCPGWVMEAGMILCLGPTRVSALAAALGCSCLKVLVLTFLIVLALLD